MKLEPEIRQIIIDVLAEKLGNKPDKIKWYIFDLSKAIATYIENIINDCDNKHIIKLLNQPLDEPKVSLKLAIEKLEDIHDVCVDYDGYVRVEDLRELIDDIKAYTIKSIKSLNEQK